MNARQRIAIGDITDIGAIAAWCQLKGGGRWAEFRAAVADVDEALDPRDVARALIVDCVIDVDFDGASNWSCAQPALVSDSSGGEKRVVGASSAYGRHFQSFYGHVEIDPDYLAVGSRWRLYRYAAVRRVAEQVGEQMGLPGLNTIPASSLIRAIPGIAKIVATAEEVDPPAAGSAAERFCVSCEALSFDAVPEMEYRTEDFRFPAGCEPELWRLRSGKSVLVHRGRTYRIQAEVGRLHVIADRVKAAGRDLRVDWYSSLDGGQLTDVVAIPRVPMPIVYRRALRVLGAIYPPFSDSGRLWVVGVRPEFARLFSERLGMSFRKVP